MRERGSHTYTFRCVGLHRNDDIHGNVQDLTSDPEGLSSDRALAVLLAGLSIKRAATGPVPEALRL